MSGLETCANASIVNRNSIANRLATMMTKPLQLNHLRKMDRRETRPGFISSLIALRVDPGLRCVAAARFNLYNWLHGYKKGPRPIPYDYPGPRLVLVALCNKNYFLKVRM